MDSQLALGFAGQSKPWHLMSHLFPDKIGGRPAWLALKHLPTTKELSCPNCSNPMCFLLQIYSPISERNDCFHRFFFLFMCRKGNCHSAECIPPFAVFRSQLPRQNSYYSYEPPETEYPTEQHIQNLASQNLIPWIGHFGPVCPVCGCRADKACAKCKRIYYCSKAHQVLDWKNHKPKCNLESDTLTSESGILNFNSNDFLLPEYRLCSELANDQLTNTITTTVDSSDDDDDDDDDEDTEIDPSSCADGDEEVVALASVARRETKEEVLFRRLKEAMSSEPDQVVRFQRNGKPLWLTLEPPEIPNCEVCGAKRCFEFQVTPQLLHYLKLDKVNEKSPDFGSLYIFACSESCALPRQQTIEINGPGSDQTSSTTPTRMASRTVEYQPEYVIRQFVP